MATKVFLHNASTQVGVGTLGQNLATLAGATSGWQTKGCDSTQGSVKQAITQNTANGPTSGIEFAAAAGGTPLHWISPPLSAAVTIAGTITFNLWGLENSMTANAGFQVKVERLSNTGAVLSTICNSEFGTELNTVAAVNTWTVTPTSTAMAKGDRLRITVAINDAGGTLATAFTATLDFDAGTGVDGDSYVSFTEALTFMTAPAGTQLFLTDTKVSPSSPYVAGDTGWLIAATLTDVSSGWTNAQNARLPDSALASFPSAGSTTQLRFSDFGIALPAGAIILGYAVLIRAGLAGPIGSASLTSQLVDASGASTGVARGASFVPSSSADYVLGTGTTDLWGATLTAADLADPDFGMWVTLDSVPIGATPGTIDYAAIKVYYTLNATARKASSSRGAGSVNSITNTVVGWTAPVQVTDSAGGTALEWFTDPLQAFTLAGMASFNIRGLESNASANVAVRCEVAICNADLSGPVVWGSFDAGGSLTGELSTIETAQTVYVAGADAAVGAGQRLRFRVYLDDASDAAMGSGFTVTVTYNGTTGAAAGDSFVTLPQAVVAYKPSLVIPPRSASRKHLLRR